MKKIFLILATLFSCVGMYAQTVTDNPLQKVFKPQMFAMSNFSLQVGLNDTKYTGIYDKHRTKALDVRFGYDLSPKCVLGIQANLLGAMSFLEHDIVKRSYTPDSGDNTPESFTIDYLTSFSTTNIYIFNRIYLANNTHKRWGLYLASNLGAALVKLDISPAGYYDPNKFKPRDQGVQIGSLTIPTMGVGLGAHWKAGPVLFTPEAMMSIPLNAVKYPYIYNPLPFHFQLSGGVAVPFGKRE